MSDANTDLAVLFTARSGMAVRRRDLALKVGLANPHVPDGAWEQLVLLHQCIEALDAAIADTEELLGDD